MNLHITKWETLMLLCRATFRCRIFGVLKGKLILLRVLIASIISALLIMAGVSLCNFLFPEGFSGLDMNFVEMVAISPAEEDCRLIQAKIELLRNYPSGGSCKDFDGCAMIEQSCSSAPKSKAEKVNSEFDRLFSKARELNCKIDVFICEFYFASCVENACVVEHLPGGYAAPEKLPGSNSW